MTLLTVIISCIFAGCDDPMPGKLEFIGDSIVARWYLPVSFPAFLTDNHGVSGSGIKYISNCAGQFDGATVVTLFGTNDAAKLADNEIDDYCADYIAAVKGLGGAHTYVLAIPPREMTDRSSALNKLIDDINSRLKPMVEAEPSMTWVDIHTPLSCGEGLNMNYSLDGLHLNVYGYEIISKILTDSLL